MSEATLRKPETSEAMLRQSIRRALETSEATFRMHPLQQLPASSEKREEICAFVREEEKAV